MDPPNLPYMPDPWDVYYVHTSISNPPKSKFVVVAHVDEGAVIGFFINTRIPAFAQSNSDILSHHLLITVDDHPFLKYDSYMDCSRHYDFILREFTDFRGCLSPEVIGDVQDIIDSSRLIRGYYKLLFLG